MSIISLADAKAHLRVVSSAEDADIQSRLDAAELAARRWIGRNLYTDAGQLATAKAGAPAALSAATAAYEAAVTASEAMTNATEALLSMSAAEQAYGLAQQTYRMTMFGAVMEPDLRAACLLILGALYEDRERADMPQAAMSLLQPWKAYG